MFDNKIEKFHLTICHISTAITRCCDTMLQWQQSDGGRTVLLLLMWRFVCTSEARRKKKHYLRGRYGLMSQHPCRCCIEFRVERHTMDSVVAKNREHVDEVDKVLGTYLFFTDRRTE